MSRALYQSRRLTGQATAEGTARYFDEFAQTYPEYRREAWCYRLSGDPAWSVSRLGFGTYRVSRGLRGHFDALREALLSGTNVIDTAANYADGEAEALVGDVLSSVLAGGRVTRDQLVLIGKAGYIQGRNLELYERNRARYTEAVWIYDRLLHCIQPEFLRDQIDFSCRRLGVECLDLFLLHNPEYYLRRAAADGVPGDEARAEMEQRFARAFECLEELKAAGRIGAYGISGGTLAAPIDSEYTALSLERILALATPGFRAIQFPANLLETEFRYSRLSGGGVLADVAEAAGLWTIANRPLNAMPPDRSLVRLARAVNPPPDEGASTVAEFNRMIDRLTEAEDRVLEIFGPRHFLFDRRTPAPSSLVQNYKNTFSHKESFRENRARLGRDIQRTINYLQAIAQSTHERYAIESLVRLSNGIFALWERYVDMRYHFRLADLETALGTASPALQEQPLAVQALLWLLARPVPATALVGMRQMAYVRQLCQVYASELPPTAELLGVAAAAERALDTL